MATAVKEAVTLPKVTLPLVEEEKPKTYKTQALDETKDYHFVMRTVNQPPGPGTVSPERLDDDVSAWRTQGYVIHSIHFLGPYMPEGAGRVFGFTFGYHLVRG